MHRRKFPTLCAPLSPPHGNPAYESTDNKFEPVAPFNFTESPPYTPSVLSSPGYSPSSPDYTPTMPAPPSPSAPLSAPQPAPLSAPQYVPLSIPATAAAAPQYVPPSANSVSGPLRTAELMLETAGVHWQLSKVGLPARGLSHPACSQRGACLGLPSPACG